MQDSEGRSAAKDKKHAQAKPVDTPFDIDGSADNALKVSGDGKHPQFPIQPESRAGRTSYFARERGGQTVSAISFFCSALL